MAHELVRSDEYIDGILAKVRRLWRLQRTSELRSLINDVCPHPVHRSSMFVGDDELGRYLDTAAEALERGEDYIVYDPDFREIDKD